jgi:hypothetical protein
MVVCTELWVDLNCPTLAEAYKVAAHNAANKLAQLRQPGGHA